MTIIQRFLRLFQDSGFLLIFSAILALAVANSPFHGHYTAALSYVPPIHLFGKSLTVQAWINDLLMAGFFLLVGLEIKRELCIGELNTWSKASLPAIAAIGGMIAPAIIYLLINWHYPEHWSGWAIPSATDIAFSLAILGVLGSRIPLSLKIFLTALAIIDDLGAIIIIATFYTDQLYVPATITMLFSCAALHQLHRKSVSCIWPYIILGAALWTATLLSGIHATLAGVLLAIFIPLNTANNFFERLEHNLQPIVAYFIMPVFGFANSGLNFDDFRITDFLNPLPLGIILGLFVGKQIGIFGACYAYTRGRPALLPQGCNFRHIYGISILGGIGFTMSLFIGSLAFAGPQNMEQIKLGVLFGSILSAILGYCILSRKTS
ncbi:MAG: Na+/H+ antiporter NhaA [Alphaproteobacteria bacterium]|nr:MAG: Na+/H+ antiporter NhaA [Alphaproteobacteria bacterium]